MEADQRAALFGAKLAALVRGRWSDVDGRPGGFPDGATFAAGEQGWVLVGPDGAVAFGGLDVVEFADDGRLAGVVGFLGDLSAA